MKKRKNLLDCRTVFAFEALEGVEAGFDGRQGCGIGLERVSVGLQSTVEARQCFRKVSGLGGKSFCGRVQSSQLTCRPDEFGDAITERRPLSGNARQKGLAQLENARGIRGCTMPPQQDLLFGGVWGGCLDFLALMSQGLQLPGERLFVGRQLIALVFELGQRAPCAGEGLALRIQSGKAVQESGLLIT